MAAPVLFISYRREDAAGHAGRIYDRLAAHFGRERVFRDVEGIQAGVDFVDALNERLARAGVLLVLIGPRWLTATDDEGRWRLADEEDLVRIEIVSALDRKLRVIPVLLQGAAMPKEGQLPGDLSPLARRNAAEIRDTSFDQDLAQLIRALEPSWRSGLTRLVQSRSLMATALMLIAITAGSWTYLLLRETPERARTQLISMGLPYDADTFVGLARDNDIRSLRLFLRAGMAPDVRNSDNQTALMHAAAKGHIDVVRSLVERGADVDRPLVWAAGNGKQDVLDYLLAHKPEPQAIGAAMVAAADSHTAIVRQLLDLGVDVDHMHEDVTALGEAAGKRNVEAVRLLLARGARADPATANGWLPLHRAIAGGSDGDEPQDLLDVVKALLDNGANIEARTRSMTDWQPTPLLLAVDEKLPRVTGMLVERGADIEAQTAYYDSGRRGRSPLMWAAQEGSLEIVRTLLASGAMVDARNDHGETALMVAAGESWPSQAAVVHALLAAGADVNARTRAGSTALMRAAASDNGVLAILLDAGADAKIANDEGWTALMSAAEWAETENARRLLAKGADPAARNHDGDDAMALAEKNGRKEIVRLLRSFTGRAPGGASIAAGRR